MDDYLMHVGRGKLDGAKVGSGRYPLGSGKRPYQGYPEKRLKKEARRAARNARKLKKNAPQPVEKLTDEEKQRVIEKGDIKSAFKHVDQFSNKDIDDVITRYRKQRDLGALTREGVKTGRQKFNDFSNLMRDVGTLGENAIKAYNPLARFLNTFAGTEWPIVSTGKDK